MDLMRQSEIPKDLIALMGYFEARNGRFSIFADVVYVKVGLGEGMVRTVGADALNASVGVSAGLKYEMAIAEMAAAYEVAHWGSTVCRAPAPPSMFSAARVDGGKQPTPAYLHRVRSISAILRATPMGPIRRSARRWADPLVGARLRHQFAPGWNFVASGDVGGFGVGSKFSWQALAVAQLRFLRPQQRYLERHGWLQGPDTSITRKATG